MFSQGRPYEFYVNVNNKMVPKNGYQGLNGSFLGGTHGLRGISIVQYGVSGLGFRGLGV